MRYAIVTETYPPEVNGVALTVQALEQGLRARGHDVSVVRPRQAALGWMRRFHNRADATVVPTRELADFLQTQHFDNVRRLPRAVDTRLFDPACRDQCLRSGWGLQEDGVAAIHVGRIAAEKNLDLAVRAFRQLQATLQQSNRPAPRFVWVGDGPARARLQRDNPDFIFCGIQREEALARHFASGDLFLFPSHSETFGNVTLEAMASGVPTVAFDYGAAREHLRDGLHGAAIADGDDDGFIAAAARIGGDARQRAAMARAGREAIGWLRPEQVAADFDELLHGLVAAARSTPRAGRVATPMRTQATAAPRPDRRGDP